MKKLTHNLPRCQNRALIGERVENEKRPTYHGTPAEC